jgi:hypothetical protein
MKTVILYWPAVVARLYLAYTAAGGHTGELPGAITAFLAALGLNHSAAAAHLKIDALT